MPDEAIQPSPGDDEEESSSSSGGGKVIPIRPEVETNAAAQQIAAVQRRAQLQSARSWVNYYQQQKPAWWGE